MAICGKTGEKRIKGEERGYNVKEKGESVTRMTRGLNEDESVHGSSRREHRPASVRRRGTPRSVSKRGKKGGRARYSSFSSCPFHQSQAFLREKRGVEWVPTLTGEKRRRKGTDFTGASSSSSTKWHVLTTPF